MQNLINISIDDVSPHPMSSISVIDRCFELIEDFEDIKFTIFVPTAYWRTTRHDIATSQPLWIDKYPTFCEAIKKLPASNFEIGYHGHYHGIPGVSDNDEMKSLTKKEATELIAEMKNTVIRAGLDNTFKKIVRPPAWRMSPEAIRAFRADGFDVLALNPKLPWSDSYKNEHLKVEDVVYATSYPPILPLELLDKTEIVYHACEWDKNHLNREKVSELSKFLRSHQEKSKFVFIDKLLEVNNGKV